MCRERAKSFTFRSLSRKEIKMRDILIDKKKYNTQAEKLNKAKKAKNDDFYTQYSDIQKELEHYDKAKFEDKVIYLPCDIPQSNFVAYFKEHYEDYKYKELVYTYIAREENEEVFAYSFDGKNEIKTKLNGNGAFQSDECVNIMKRADWVITNPPFSILSIFIKQLKDLNKRFIICIPVTSLTTKIIFNNIINKNFYTGFTELNNFINENNELATVNVLWLTTEKHIPQKKVKEIKYKLVKYDNYDALEVSKLIYLEHILDKGLKGKYGVPITILKSYLLYLPNIDVKDIIEPTINNKNLFKRVLIEIK